MVMEDVLVSLCCFLVVRWGINDLWKLINCICFGYIGDVYIIVGYSIDNEIYMYFIYYI